MVTIHVLACGELFAEVLNAITAFMKQDSFTGLLRITAFAGIVMATVGYLKTRDPMAFGKWFAGYVLFINLALLPKTTVLVDDISSQVPKLIDNVPVVFAVPASLVTSIGYGLAQSYDALLTLPDDLLYTQTGSLFASRLIQAARDFHIVNPELKEEMDNYFRTCVVGDIRLNHKYSVSDLANSPKISELISKHASPLRMIKVNKKLVTCQEAARTEGNFSLLKKLDAEIKVAYQFFGVNLFGKPKSTSYETLFSTRLTSAFNYYQGLTDSASDIMMQSMMINAVGDGIRNYQAFTDSAASVVNQQFSKSQVQHRWSWQIAGLKALWFLPLLHTLLTLLLFGVFPVIVAAATLPGGTRILFGYFQFFVSLQFWPVLFAILNAAMTMYGHSKSMAFGQITMVNLDKVDELHQDIAGVAGYMMLLIPFLANGLVSNLGAAFNGLATSMTGHLQGSAMSLAGEAASGSFGLGQTSFYNTTANNFSANKHDSNWSHMHGMHTEQMGSGVLKTITGQGGAVFDVSPGMSRGAVSISGSKGLSTSLNQAYEESKQAASNESQHYQTSLSNFAHRAIQLSNLSGHDMRLGDGVSVNESGQYSKAISKMTHIATDVAQRTGMSTDDALAHMTSGGWGSHAGLRSDHSIPGKLAQYVTGASAGADTHLKFDRSSTTSNRSHDGFDNTISAKEAQDFNDAFNYVKHFSQSHHFDDSVSTAASLSNQMGADLRDAQTASHNYDASISKAERISEAKSYVESNSEQINTNLDQVFPGYVASRIGTSARDELFNHPGDANALHQQQALAEEFIASKRDELISEFGHKASSGEIDSFYNQRASLLAAKEDGLATSYKMNSTSLNQEANNLQLGANTNKSAHLTQHVDGEMQLLNNKTQHDAAALNIKSSTAIESTNQKIEEGKYKATNGVIPYHAVDNTLEKLHIKEKK